jgi:hypothetical protein
MPGHANQPKAVVDKPRFGNPRQNAAPITLVQIRALKFQTEGRRNSVVTKWDTRWVHPAVPIMRLDDQNVTDVLVASLG